MTDSQRQHPASAVSGDQEIVLVTGGNQITARDFYASSSLITIPDGETSGSVTVTIWSDFLRQDTETLELSIVNPSLGIRLGAVTEQSIAIEDDATKHVTVDPVPRFPIDTTPTFTWNDLGADRYEVWLQQTSPVSSRLQMESRFLTDTSYTSTEALTAGTYRVWVRVSATTGDIGSWSPGVSFEFQPRLLAPLSAVSTSRPTFSWEAIPGAQTYQIYIGTSSGRSIESVESQPVTDTIDAPDRLLSLLWEQQQLSERLLTSEHS